MAGFNFTINFDTGIEKVEYSNSLNAFPQGEVNSSGQTITSASAEFYVRPIFKQGYEIDTTNVAPTSSSSGIYECIVDHTPVHNVTFTSKQSASSPTFKHFFNSGTIGSGTIKFRHFSQTEPLPQLATPTNVTVDGTTLSWDAVENATSYDIYADGTFIGNTDGGSSGGTVTFNVQENGIGKRGYFRIYDGTNTSGTLLYEITDSTTAAIPNPLSINCSTGHLYVDILSYGAILTYITGTTGGVTATLGPDDTYIDITVTSNGTIGLSIDYND